MYNKCPYCGYISDRVTDAFENNKPQEGDLSVCINCCEGSWFDENLSLVKIDINDMDNQEYSRFLRVQNACKEVKKEE